MQSSEKDLPSTRRRDSIRFFITVAGLTVIALVAVLAALVTAREGNAGAARYCLLFAFIMALTIAYPTVVRYRRVDLSTVVRTVEHDGITGTEIRQSSWQLIVLIALMASFTAFFGMGAVDYLGEQDDESTGAAVVAGALSAVFASFLVPVALGRIRRGGVTLSSQGVAQRGWSFESKLDWSAIVAAPLASLDGFRFPTIILGGSANADWIRRYTTRLWRIDRLPQGPVLQLDCDKFDVDPHVLNNYIRTYVDNPELRYELGTEAALTRARQMQADS
ncbi:hypothetical protein [Mycolicibacterium thermoresistibile]